MATIKTRQDYYKKTAYFTPFNPNPSENSDKSTKGDCVIRAFAIAADIDWLEAFDKLTAYARETYNVPNDKNCYKVVFEQFGFLKRSVGVEKGKFRMTVEDFCKTHPKGRYILRIAHHLTAVVNGKVYDTWNTANKSIYYYWELCKK